MQSKNSMAAFAIGLLLVSLALIIGPWVLTMPFMVKMVAGGFGVLGLVIGAVLVTIAKLYVKTSANMAFYRTGQGKPKVIIDGGALVIPVVHELITVSLETMKLEVERLGADALICKDFLRADIKAEFFIRVKKDEDGVKAAATSLGRDATNSTAIKNRFMEKLVSALRTVAATMDLSDLNQNREDFARKVQEAVTKDIEPNGLFLETVTISKLDQTDVKNLKDDNVFDAQGLRKAAEITAAAKVKRNEITRGAELQITERDVTTKKAVLEQQQDVAFAEADQKKEVANRQAVAQAETQKFAIGQSEEVAKREVAKDQAVAQAQFAKDAELSKAAQLAETAEVIKDQGVQAAQIQRDAVLVGEDQKKQTAEVAREQAVQVANRLKEVAVADAEEQRAEAQAKQRLAEAKEREAAQKVVTAAEVEVANREKSKAVINAEKEGEMTLISQKKAADAKAYTQTREALAEKESAENQALATIRLAEANLEAQKKSAEGKKAVEMVPVQVASEQVEVDRKAVEVLQNKLKAQDTYQQAAIALEIRKLEIQAGQVVGVEMARAVGTFMSKGEMNIFGDPEALARMTRSFNDGLGVTKMLEGLGGNDSPIGQLVSTAMGAAKAGLNAAAAKANEVVDGSGKKGKGKGEPAPSAPTVPPSAE